MSYDPRIPGGGRATRAGYVHPGNQEDAKRRKADFPNSFKYTIIIILLVIVLAGINMALNCNQMVSNRDYKGVETILIDDGAATNDHYDEEEFFTLVKNSWTKIPSKGVLVSQAEEFIQHKIKIVYTDGTEDEIYLYYNPYKSSQNGYVLRMIINDKGEKTVISYNAYEKLMEYIDNSIK